MSKSPRLRCWLKSHIASAALWRCGRAKGEPFEAAVLDAGIMRLRPVLITVGATVIALFPLAIHGRLLWQPMCYAQIGGLTAATFITLLLVPVIYSICVLDLKIVAWSETPLSE